MHPVICGKLSSKCRNRSSIGTVITIVCPFYCLHAGTQSTIIAIDIHTQEFSIASTCFSHFRFNTFCFCIFQLCTTDTGSCSVSSCRKAEAVTIFCYCGCQICVIFQTALTVSTRQFFSVFYNCIVLAKCFVIFRFHFYRNIFQPGYYIMINVIFVVI